MDIQDGYCMARAIIAIPNYTVELSMVLQFTKPGNVGGLNGHIKEC